MSESLGASRISLDTLFHIFEVIFLMDSIISEGKKKTLCTFILGDEDQHYGKTIVNSGIKYLWGR